MLKPARVFFFGVVKKGFEKFVLILIIIAFDGLIYYCKILGTTETFW